MEHLNVAIADDNQRILDMLETVISMDKELNLVGKAKNGEEMCQIIKDKKPDVVLLDLIMPKMDGLTVMEQVSQDKNVSKRPYFIVVTAVGQERITEDAFNKGANYYIMKPFNNEMLLNRIKSVRKMFRNNDKKNEMRPTEKISKTVSQICCMRSASRLISKGTIISETRSSWQWRTWMCSMPSQRYFIRRWQRNIRPRRAA